MPPDRIAGVKVVYVAFGDDKKMRRVEVYSLERYGLNRIEITRSTVSSYSRPLSHLSNAMHLDHLIE
jgi:hypothetical protein